MRELSRERGGIVAHPRPRSGHHMGGSRTHTVHDPTITWGDRAPIRSTIRPSQGGSRTSARVEQLGVRLRVALDPAAAAAVTFAVVISRVLAGLGSSDRVVGGAAAGTRSALWPASR
jgi:hypothetical protein